MEQKRIKNIEFLRIIGCLAIILFHLCNKNRLYGLFSDIDLYSKLYSMFQNGNKAVDLFFIMSGLFFGFKLDITKPLLEFIKHKLIRVYPLLVYCIVLFFLISLTGAVEFTFYDNILNLLCLNGTFLVLKSGNMGVFWYVSAMLWTMILFYYLIKYFGKPKANLVIAILAIFSYGFIIHAKGGTISNSSKTFYNIFNVGMMRAFGGIGLGYFISEWYKENIQSIKNVIYPIWSRLLITVVEFMCLYFIINNLMLHKLHYKNHMIFIVTFALIIILFLMKKGFISLILDNDIWSKFSRYTYSLYMTHTIVMNTLKGSLWKHYPTWVYAHPAVNVVMTLALVLLFGIFTYHFVEKPCTRYLTQRAEIPVSVERERERERERENSSNG